MQDKDEVTSETSQQREAGSSAGKARLLTPGAEEREEGSDEAEIDDGIEERLLSPPEDERKPAPATGTGRRGLNGLLNRLQAARLLLVAPSTPTSQAVVVPVSVSPEEAFPRGDITLEAARWSRRRDIPLAILAWAGVVLLTFWLAGHVASTLLMLIIAALLAYALAPLVGILQRVMPRLLAILIVYLIVLVALGALLYFIVRTAVDQITSLSGNLQEMLTPGKPGHPTGLERTLGTFGISQSQINTIRGQVIGQLGGAAGGLLPLVTGVAGGLLDIVLVTILSIYLLFDGSRAVSWFRRDMPRRQRGRVRFLLSTIQRIVGGYIRGQLLMCSLIGVLVGIGMQLFSVPYALLLGVVAFVLEFIPVLGTLLSGVICVLLALTRGWLVALFVLLYFIGVHILEGDVVGPRIIGKAIGLHPVVSIVALIAGGELFGVWGALFGSPVAGVLQALLVAIWSEWKEAHPEEFQAAKQQAIEKVTSNMADHPVEPEEPAEKLL